MPSNDRSDIDWATARRDFEAGVLSQGEISRRAGIARQTLKQRADREGWLYGAAVVADPLAGTDIDADAPPSLAECRAMIERDSSTAARYEAMTPDKARQWRATPDHLARALRAAYEGARHRVMADAAGLDDQTLRRVLSDDAALGGMVRAAHAMHALGSLRSLNAAQRRGDAKSAQWLLANGPYAEQYGGVAGAGGDADAVEIEP